MKLRWTSFFVSGGKAGVKMRGRELLQLQELGNFLGLPSRRAVDDGAAASVRRQAGLEYLMDMAEFFLARRRDDFELQIGPFGASVEDPESDAERVLEIPDDVVRDIGFRGRRQAKHRRNGFVAGLFPDESAKVAVVGPEVVAPFRQAVRLVHDPCADFALVQRAPQRTGTELFRCDEQDSRVAQSDPVERIGALGHRQQAVDRDAGTDPTSFESGDLVRHQRHQRRDHDREGTDPVVSRQGGDLIAQRLARARRQDAEHMFASHGRFDDGLLQRPTVVVRRFRAKIGETEPACELRARVVILTAPAAVGIGAGAIPESAHQPARFGKLMPDPRRHNRISSRDREPCQRVGQRPAGLVCIGNDLSDLRGACVAREPFLDPGPGFVGGRAGCAANCTEDRVERATAVLGIRCAQPVPGRNEIGRGLLQGLVLVAEKLECKFGVELWIVQLPPRESAILIVLDEVVVRIAGKRERTEPEGIDDR